MVLESHPGGIGEGRRLSSLPLCCRGLTPSFSFRWLWSPTLVGSMPWLVDTFRRSLPPAMPPTTPGVVCRRPCPQPPPPPPLEGKRSHFLCDGFGVPSWRDPGLGLSTHFDDRGLLPCLRPNRVVCVERHVCDLRLLFFLLRGFVVARCVQRVFYVWCLHRIDLWWKLLAWLSARVPQIIALSVGRRGVTAARSVHSCSRRACGSC